MPFLLSREFIEKAIHNMAEDERCIDLHEGSCNMYAFRQVSAGTQAMAKVYFIIHCLPLLLKYKRVGQK
jgi:uncharacterized membrane protein